MQEKSAGFAWRNFVCILVVGISYSISLMTVAMFMGDFMAEYGSNASMLMSYTSIGGTIIAFFTASIQAKLGPKMMVIMSACVQLIGDVLMIVGGGVAVMFVGRFVLGLGNGLIATAAPSLVSALWKDPQKRGLPTSIWTMWIALGSIVISFLTVPLGNWHTAFIFAAIISAVGLVLAIFGITISKEEQMAVVAGNENVHIIDAFKSPWVILLFIMVLSFAYGFSCYTTYAPTFYIENLGTSAGSALNGMGNFIGIVGGLVIGIVYRATKKHPQVLVCTFVLAVIAAFIAFGFTSAVMVVISAVMFYFVFNIIMPSVFTNVQWASPDPSVIGAAFGLLAIASNAGGIPAAPVSQAILNATGSYFAVMIPVIVITVIGLVCAIIFLVGRSKYVKEAFAAQEKDAR